MDCNEKRSFFVNLICGFYFWFLAIVKTFLPFLIRKKSVKDEIVLITGAGSGIGQLMSVEFAKLGAIIVAFDIDDNGLEKTKNLVEQCSSKCFTYNVDVTNRHRVYEIAQQVKQEVGHVYILVNNAGIVIGKNFLEINDDQIINEMNVNTISHFWTIKAFLPDMIDRQHGHIVTISSMAGKIGVNKLVPYCTSKFAVIGLTEALKLELQVNGHSNIKTTIVCPWYINTGMFSGCKGLFPVLKQNNTAKTIVNAVLQDQGELIMPRIMYMLVSLKSILPTESIRYALSLLGVDTSMDDFLGSAKRK